VFDVLLGRAHDDAMAQVQHVAGAGAASCLGRLRAALDLGLDGLLVGEEDDRVYVALQGDVICQPRILAQLVIRLMRSWCSNKAGIVQFLEGNG